MNRDGSNSSSPKQISSTDVKGSSAARTVPSLATEWVKPLLRKVRILVLVDLLKKATKDPHIVAIRWKYATKQ